MANELKRRMAHLEKAAPDRSIEPLRITRVIVVPGPDGPVPTGQVIVREAEQSPC